MIRPVPATSGLRSEDGPSTKVFLVDDDDDFREMARRILSDNGCEVTVASDGSEALEHLAAIADARTPLPDVLVLDFVMPKLSGLGLLRALRLFGRPPPTILVTGFADPSVKGFAANLGAFRVLRKPLDGEELCAAVEEAALLGVRATGLRNGA